MDYRELYHQETLLDEGYRIRKMEEAWEQFEIEQANMMTEATQSFVLEDGTVLEQMSLTENDNICNYK